MNSKLCKISFSVRFLLNILHCLRTQLQSEREQKRASTICSLKPPNKPCRFAPCLLWHFPHRIPILYKLADFVISNLLIFHFWLKFVLVFKVSNTVYCQWLTDHCMTNTVKVGYCLVFIVILALFFFLCIYFN